MFRKLCCFCRIKGKKSESNSQLVSVAVVRKEGCFCRIKGKKSESNSQPSLRVESGALCCFCRIKGKKSESNSQLSKIPSNFRLVVSAVSKVRNLKAIHN